MTNLNNQSLDQVKSLIETIITSVIPFSEGSELERWEAFLEQCENFVKVEEQNKYASREKDLMEVCEMYYKLHQDFLDLETVETLLYRIEDKDFAKFLGTPQSFLDKVLAEIKRKEDAKQELLKVRRDIAKHFANKNLEALLPYFDKYKGFICTFYNNEGGCADSMFITDRTLKGRLKEFFNTGKIIGQ